MHHSLSSLGPSLLIIIGILAIWSIVWKGLALWKSARNGSKVWFIILLILNTVGILDLIYYFFVGNEKKS